MLDDYLVGYNTKRPYQGRGMNGRRLSRLRQKDFRSLHSQDDSRHAFQRRKDSIKLTRHSFPPQFFLQLAKIRRGTCDYRLLPYLALSARTK